MEKREYNSEKEFLLYLPMGSDEKWGFLNESGNLVERICDATRFTSVESNRVCVDFQKKDGRYPFKLKVCNYKNLVF